jgi:hypothetical protein
MYPKFAKLIVPPILVFSVCTNAADLVLKGRGNFTVTVNKLDNSEDNLDFNSSEGNLKYLLQTKGVRADDKSKVWVREEDKKVELNCFDCLILNSNNSIYGREPHNEEHRGDGI